MAQHQEPCLLEYARFYGVSTNHLAISPFDLITPELKNLYESRPIPENTPSLDFSFPEPPLEKELRNEKLDVGREGALFLSSIVKESSAKTTNNIVWDRYLPERRRVRNLKDELPLLKTVHELDMASFGQERITLDPATLNLPMEKTRDDDDEGLLFPKDFWHLPDKVWEDVKTEKLDCTREAFVLIQEVGRSGDLFTNEARDEFCERTLHYVKRRELQPLSPLLLPRETPFTLHIPSSSTANVSVLSSPESPLPAGSAEIQQRKEEEAVLEYIRERSADLHIDSFSNVESIRQPRQNFQWDEMNEEIISPPGSARIASEKSAAGETQESVIMDGTESSIDADQPNTAGEMLDDHLVEIAYAAMQEVELPLKDGLSLMDQIVGTDLSDIAPMSLISPWNMRCSSADEDCTVQDTHTSPRPIVEFEEHSPKNCPEGSEKDRIPVCQLPHEISDPVVNAKSIEDGGSMGTIQDLLSKQTKQELLVKESDDNNKHLVSETPNTATDLNTLREEYSQTIVSEQTGCLRSSQQSQHRRKRKNRTPDTSGQNLKRINRQKNGFPVIIGQGDSPLSSAFSALGSLSSFMETRGKVSKQTTERSSYFSTSPTHCDHTSEDSPQKEQIDTCDQQKEMNEEIEILADIATPTLHSRQQIHCPLTLVLSTSLLKTDRHIVRYLENLTPSPTLIFRDYGKYLYTDRHYQVPPGTSIKRKNQYNNIRPPAEADIILSPSTGIILTTSQATTQLYLPGHKPPPHSQMDGFPQFDSPLRERIARTCIRYERIYVMICHSQTSSTKSSSNNNKGSIKVNMTTDPRTLSSIRSLMAFCASLAEYCTVILLLVPSSSSAWNNPTVEWILSLATKHTFSIPEKQRPVPKNIGFTPINGKRNTTQTTEYPLNFPHEEETHWELFLRQAGLNPFAAQAVMAIINAQDREEEQVFGAPHDQYHCPDDIVEHQEPRRQPQGLSSFIEMHPEQRRRLFGHVVGERVLKRVESVIGRRWQFEETFDPLSGL